MKATKCKCCGRQLGYIVTGVVLCTQQHCKTYNVIVNGEVVKMFDKEFFNPSKFKIEEMAMSVKSIQ